MYSTGICSVSQTSFSDRKNLNPSWYTKSGKGSELEVDRRTAYRIRETLEELGFPLYDDTSSLDGKKRYRFEESYLQKLPNMKVPELNLSLSELDSRLAWWNTIQFHDDKMKGFKIDPLRFFERDCGLYLVRASDNIWA